MAFSPRSIEPGRDIGMAEGLDDTSDGPSFVDLEVAAPQTAVGPRGRGRKRSIIGRRDRKAVAAGACDNRRVQQPLRFQSRQVRGVSAILQPIKTLGAPNGLQ